MSQRQLEISTVVEVDVYARHWPRAAGQTDFSSYHVVLPEFLGHGLVRKEDGTTVYWSFNQVPKKVSIPADIEVTEYDEVFTAHRLRLSNNHKIDDTYPCLESAPRAIESLQSFLTGMVTYQSISFSILDPTLRVYFAADFEVTNSRIRMLRYIQKSPGNYRKDVIWRGFLTKVTYPDAIRTSISTRQDLKRMDNKATFGFEDQLDTWPGRKIPIVACVIVPYSITLTEHPPVLPFYYDKEDQTEDYEDAFELVTLPPDDEGIVRQELDRIKIDFLKGWIESLKPRYVSMDHVDLVPSVMTMHPDTFDIYFQRGIFFAPTEAENPTRSHTEGANTWQLSYFDVHGENYERCLQPYWGTEILYGEAGAFPLNKAASYTNWAIVELGNVPTPAWVLYDPNYDWVPHVYFKDGSKPAARPIHPFDSFFVLEENSSNYQFRWVCPHAIHRFKRRMLAPRVTELEYQWKYWANYWRSPTLPKTALITSKFDTGISGTRYDTFRCKDLYRTTSVMKGYPPVKLKDGSYVSLSRYEAGETFLFKGEFQGFSGDNLRAMPMIPQNSFYNLTGTNNEIHSYPKTHAVRSPHKGGAYYVGSQHGAYATTAEEATTGVGNYDTSPSTNAFVREAFSTGDIFKGYYHHHYLSNSDALRPSVFLFACVKAAGLEPGFRQDGTGIPGPLNKWPMQLVASTDVTYVDLFRRILPALGYILKMNYTTGKTDIVYLLSDPPADRVHLTEDDVEFNAIDYNSSDQYTSMTFENPDMTRGANTLDDFKGYTAFQGKTVLFNKNPFILSKTVDISYGTLACDTEDVFERLTTRHDIYRFKIPTAVIFKDIDNPIVLEIGDWVTIRTSRVPSTRTEVTVQVVYKDVSELYYEIHALSYAD